MLTKEQLQSYKHDGYLILPYFLNQEEVREIKSEATKICRGAYQIPGISKSDENETDEQCLAKYLCIHMPHKVSPIMEKYVRHPKIAEALSELISPNVKCMQSMLFIKPPGFPGQAYHQDERYIPTEDRSLTGVWMAIDEATIRNGCLWVIPGTHKDALYSWAPHDNPEYDGADETQDIPRSKEIPVEIPSGGAVFFNGFLLHSSLKNRSSIYRRVLVNHYMSAESCLPWQGREDFRDIIIVSGTDPHSDKGYEDISHPHLRALRREKQRVIRQ